MNRRPIVLQRELSISGRVVRVARLYGEYHEYLDEPLAFINEIHASSVPACIFTFLQPLTDREPRYSLPHEDDSVAVVTVSTYEDWWKRQISDKTRNMVRKAGKKGVIVAVAPFDGAFVQGIQEIYNEARIRQGKPFKHYGKDLETLHRAHATYLDRSIFLGAYFEGKLIGFIKLILQGQVATIMQILSMIVHRDKAPNNALIAKAVEVAAQNGVKYLQYGMWSRRSLGEFKMNHGFEEVKLPRYYAPLSFWGKIALSCNLHRDTADLLPGGLMDSLVDLRTRWYYFKHRDAANANA